MTVAEKKLTGRIAAEPADRERWALLVEERFALVKRHHPDANGGDREAEERLKVINEAFTTLKGFFVPQTSPAG